MLNRIFFSLLIFVGFLFPQKLDSLDKGFIWTSFDRNREKYYSVRDSIPLTSRYGNDVKCYLLKNQWATLWFKKLDYINEDSVLKEEVMKLSSCDCGGYLKKEYFKYLKKVDESERKNDKGCSIDIRDYPFLPSPSYVEKMYDSTVNMDELFDSLQFLDEFDSLKILESLIIDRTE